MRCEQRRPRLSEDSDDLCPHWTRHAFVRVDFTVRRDEPHVARSDRQRIGLPSSPQGVPAWGHHCGQLADQCTVTNVAVVRSRESYDAEDCIYRDAVATHSRTVLGLERTRALQGVCLSGRAPRHCGEQVCVCVCDFAPRFAYTTARWPRELEAAQVRCIVIFSGPAARIVASSAMTFALAYGASDSKLGAEQSDCFMPCSHNRTCVSSASGCLPWAQSRR